jgi:autoinducer 2-degrading protein
MILINFCSIFLTILSLSCALLVPHNFLLLQNSKQSQLQHQIKNQFQMSQDGNHNYPIALVVSVEIKEDRLEDFLKVIEADAIGSRERENGGCLRFDVLQDKTNKCKFQFYEVYINEDAVTFHKATDHFKLWTDFKASGGVVSQTAVKSDALFYT